MRYFIVTPNDNREISLEESLKVKDNFYFKSRTINSMKTYVGTKVIQALHKLSLKLLLCS